MSRDVIRPTVDLKVADDLSAELTGLVNRVVGDSRTSVLTRQLWRLASSALLMAIGQLEADLVLARIKDPPEPFRPKVEDYRQQREFADVPPGRCHYCTSPAVGGSTMCVSHLAEYTRQRARA